MKADDKVAIQRIGIVAHVEKELGVATRLQYRLQSLNIRYSCSKSFALEVVNVDQVDSGIRIVEL